MGVLSSRIWFLQVVSWLSLVGVLFFGGSMISDGRFGWCCEVWRSELGYLFSQRCSDRFWD